MGAEVVGVVLTGLIGGFGLCGLVVAGVNALWPWET